MRAGKLFLSPKEADGRGEDLFPADGFGIGRGVGVSVQEEKPVFLSDHPVQDIRAVRDFCQHDIAASDGLTASEQDRVFSLAQEWEHTDSARPKAEASAGVQDFRDQRHQFVE